MESVRSPFPHEDLAAHACPCDGVVWGLRMERPHHSTARPADARPEGRVPCTVTRMALAGDGPDATWQAAGKLTIHLDRDLWDEHVWVHAAAWQWHDDLPQGLDSDDLEVIAHA
ncbi:MAG: hypothetical protein UHD09_07150 [Bifidobacterium sp.]|nr:hypothetical protein [Bifidobacterium sp.]